MSNNIHNLFPTPFYVVDAVDNDLNDIISEYNSKLLLLKEHTVKDKLFNVSTTYDFDTNNYLIDRFDFYFLKRFISYHVEQYYSISKDYVDRSFFIDCSWFTFIGKNGFIDEKVQPDSQITGLFYLQSTKNNSNICFKSPNPFLSLNLFPSSFNDEYSNSMFFYSNIGRLILFPSWISHKVDYNTSEDECVVCFFNVKFL